MSKVICSSCGNVQEYENLKDEVYFPNRVVYSDNKLVSCNSCSNKNDMIIAGKNYISPIHLGFEKYLTDGAIIESNKDWYKNQIKETNNPITKERYITMLSEYEQNIVSYKNKNV